MQAETGLDMMQLIEDPQSVTLNQLLLEVTAHGKSTAFIRSDKTTLLKNNQASQAQTQPDTAHVVGSPWIAPAPSFIKMRVFCLPYAGGVSENIFARCAVVRHARRHCSSSI